MEMLLATSSEKKVSRISTGQKVRKNVAALSRPWPGLVQSDCGRSHRKPQRCERKESSPIRKTSECNVCRRSALCWLHEAWKIWSPGPEGSTIHLHVFGAGSDEDSCQSPRPGCMDSCPSATVVDRR